MKPLEWVFLLVLYLTDANPENRIALQYMPPAEKAKLQKAMAEKNTTAQGRHAKEGKVTVMKQENIAKWLKAIVIGTALFGVGIYGYVIPTWGRVIVYNNPEFSDRFFPWLIFLWITAIPCYIALIFAWKIFTQIGKNNSFSYVNAKYFKHITRLALSDTVYFLLGNFVLLMWNKSHPGVFLASFLVAFVGVAIAVLCIALSHLVYKAAQMNEENELTI